jgi:putative endonuclease
MIPPKLLSYKIMQYVYILKSKKNSELYVGCTKDIKKRIELHNSGKVFSTKLNLPYYLIFYEAFLNEKDAYERERWLKTGWGRNQIRKMLRNNLKV